MAKKIKKILIVEDEPQMQKVLERKISGIGYKTAVANDGVQALQKIFKDDISLVLLDLVMPTKSGFDVLEEMKAHGSKIPVIVLSNLGEDDDVETAKRLGAKDYFVKSNISLRDIVAKISQYI